MCSIFIICNLSSGSAVSLIGLCRLFVLLRSCVFNIPVVVKMNITFLKNSFLCYTMQWMLELQAHTYPNKNYRNYLRIIWFTKNNIIAYNVNLFLLIIIHFQQLICRGDKMRYIFFYAVFGIIPILHVLL